MSCPIETLGRGIAPIVSRAGPEAADERLIDGLFQSPDAGLVTSVHRGGIERMQFEEALLEPRDRGAHFDAGEGSPALLQRFDMAFLSSSSSSSPLAH